MNQIPPTSPEKPTDPNEPACEYIYNGAASEWQRVSPNTGCVATYDGAPGNDGDRVWVKCSDAAYPPSTPPGETGGPGVG